MTSTPYQTLVHMLRSRADAQADQRIYTFLRDGETDEQHITYRELDQRARLIAARLRQIGAPGERALLIYPPGLEYVAAFFGCLYAGWIAVPSYPPNVGKQDPRLLAIIEDADAKAALTDDFIWTQLEPFLPAFPPLQAFEWVVTDRLDIALADEWQMPQTGWDDSAFFQYTSGSTGKPKGVMLTHGNLLSNLRLIRHAFDLQSGERGCSWLPPYHDMGLIGGILQPIYCDGYTVLMSPLAFLKKPLRWLQGISRYQVTVAGGPNFAYDWLVDRVDAADRAGLDLSHWSLAFNGAEPVRPETLRRFSEAYRPNGFKPQSFFPCYGLAEGTLIVSGGLRAETPVQMGLSAESLEQNQVVVSDSADAKQLISSGRTLLEQQIKIVEPNSRQPLAERSVGEIWVSGDSIARGYWKKPQVSAETLQAKLDDGTGSYLRTGDLGFLHDSELFVTGRLKDLIIIRGRNYYPQDIEYSIFHCHPVLQPNAGAAFSVDVDGVEKLVVVQEIKRRQKDVDTEAVIAAIRAAISEQHELVAHAVVLIKPRSISKTSSGKIQRRLTRSQYLKGRLEVIAEDLQESAETPPEDEPSFLRQSLLAVPDDQTRRMLVSFYLQEQIAARLGRAKSAIDANQSLTSYGLDSLLAIEIKNEIDRILAIDLPLSVMMQGPSIDELAGEIVARLDIAGEPSQLVAAANPPQQFPLTAGQRALWYLNQVAPDSAVYNVARAGRVVGGLDAARVQAAIAQVTARHPLLRTTFKLQDGEPQQTVHAIMQPDFGVHDDSADLNTLGNAPFDLTNGPLWRVHLVQHDNGDTTLLLAMHHIITDFWSLVILVDELLTAYNGDALPPAPRLHHSDVVRWEAETVVQDEAKWAYWQEQLADLTPLDLPIDHARPAVQTYHGDVVARELSADLTPSLHTLAQSQSATPFATLLAAYQLLLHRYTGQSDIAVGTPLAGRDQPQLANLLGYFANPIVLRGQLDPAQSFSDLLATTRQTILDGVDNALPLPLLVERFQRGRDLSRSPLFQTLFVVQKPFSAENAHLATFAIGSDGDPVPLGNLTVAPVALDQQTAQFDLALAMAEVNDRWLLRWEYNSDLFDRATIERIANSFEALLHAVCAAPDAPLASFNALDSQMQQQLAAWNDTSADYPLDQPLHHLFEQQVDRTPDRVAVTFADQSLTYRQLDQRANQLAHQLRDWGAQPDTLVGVCMARSLEMVVALYGILKAGAAYVPLDPDYPNERLRFMCEDANAAVVLTQADLCDKLQSLNLNGRIVALDQLDLTGQSAEKPSEVVSAENLAYVIYTSGSTGQPKGVMNTHRGIVNRLIWMQEAFGLDATDRVLQKTPYSFDVSVWEFFWPLLNGARLVVAKPHGHLDSDYLCRLIASEQITTLHFVPSMLQIFLSDRAIAHASGLRRIICSGEALPYELVTRTVAALPTTELHNLYGPTEAAIDVSWWHCQPNDAGIVPIGKPVANTQLYILDARQTPVPIGVVGELVIGGVQVAQGYWNRPNLTAERFIEIDGAKHYRTGDLVKQLPDGNIVYIGRNDFQVKLRGFRIELGEIEARLLDHPTVRAALATVVDDKLIAYLVGDGIDSADLRRHLTQTLPNYMVPNIFMPLDSFPLSNNGKVNRRKLPKPQAQSEVNYVAPRSQLEQDVSTIWAEILSVPQVGIHDNFFDLGGTSLLLVQAHRRLQDTLDKQIPLVKMLEKPTIATLTSYLNNGSATQDFTPVQQRADKQRTAARRRYR